MGVLSGNPTDEPMHYGEVFAVWSALAAAQAQLVACEVYQNHAGDKELAQLINDLIKTRLEPTIQETKKVLQTNEVPLPPAPPERPNASCEDIPPGARIMDPEIAAALTRDLATSLVANSQAMGQCIREDLGLMFEKFHTKDALFAANLLRLNKEKGWLIPPPLHLEKVEQ